MAQFTTDLERQRFEYINNLVSSYSGGKCYAEVSKIRIEETLIDGVGQYRFDIKKSDIKNNREVSLNRNDVFVPTCITVYVAVQDDDKPACEELFAYIPIAGEGSIHPVGFLNGDANAIYNGKLQWQIQNGVLFSSYPTERFKYVPQTQGSANKEQSEFSTKETTDVAIPRIYVAGTMDHRITLNFDAQGLTFGCTEGHTPKLVFYMEGFLVVGGTEYYDGKNAFGQPVVGSWGGK